MTKFKKIKLFHDVFLVSYTKLPINFIMNVREKIILSESVQKLTIENSISTKKTQVTANLKKHNTMKITEILSINLYHFV